MFFASTEAIIVTHNGGSALDRPDLRYADDDGLQYAALFRQAGARVTLLTQLDRESTVLHPNAAVDGAPTREELFAAVQRASAEDVYLVFAGHGESGYVVLADGTLSSAELEQRVLAPLDKRRVHLLIDSCNSYFMVMPRKPGGTAFKAQPPEGLLSRHPNVSVLLSTSAEAVTYEWSELQSGIFSYVVRSALRGGADADNDGTVTYAEAVAFIQVATQSIENDAYRPHVFARASAATLFKLPRSANELVIDGMHRLTLRNDKGVRLADVHTKGSIRLWLPEERIAIEERQGPHIVQRELGPTQRASLASLPLAPRAIAERGESPVFKSLFAQPFGEDSVAQAATQPTEEAYGVSKADVDRWKAVLFERAKYERTARNTAAWTLGMESAAMVAGGSGLAINSAIRGSYDASTGILLASAGIITAAIGLPVLLVRQTMSEKLWAELADLTLDSESARGAAITRISEHMLRALQTERRRQLSLGITGLAVSASLVGLGGFLASLNGTGTAGAVHLAVGGGLLVSAIYRLVTLPPKLTSIEQLEVVRQTPNFAFEGIGVGGDSKGAHAAASFTF